MKVVAMLLMLVGLCSCVNRGPVATITTAELKRFCCK